MDRILVLLHAGLGGLALLSGSIALFAQKGKPLHKGSGKVFFFAMLFSALIAIWVALLPGHYDPFLFAIGVFTSYMLVGGYRALRFKRPEVDLRIDRMVSVLMLICGIGMLTIPLVFQGVIDVVLAIFGGIGIAFVLRDFKIYGHPEQLKSIWLKVHIGKMTGAYIASITAFFVVNQIMTYYLNWLLPTVLGSIYIAYWTRKTKPKKLVKTALLVILSVFTVELSQAQVYLEQQTRHRFAQLNLGLDYQMSIGGKTSYLNGSGGLEALDLGSVQKPRFIIGGTHFWGHADFYIAIPILAPSFQSEGQEVLYTSGVETVFKYYPWRIEAKQLRPFIGTALAPFYFQQGKDEAGEEGPEKQHFSLPALAGLTYNFKHFLLELGMTYNYRNQINYYISSFKETTVNTPPLYLNFSIRYMLETTLSAEKQWISGRTAEITDHLAEKGKLNNFFLGAGMSSAWWMGASSYNEAERPFIPGYGISLMPDFALGYYWHKPDLNATLNYRGYNGGVSAYGVTQSLQRRSIGFEVTKFLFDYHGFTPFIGPAISFEHLLFKERFESEAVEKFEDRRLSYGLTFGWDIRPNRIQTFLLRTNLRWFPSLKLEVSGEKQISFNNIEFNFIQLVVFPGRF